ncbi:MULTISPECIES: hypothetical protein [unclassified Brucella]|uniref:hypothetical protein n=1 Tax=unclassified Brucella TaxID=2632610 RepID=UPI0012AE332F|nr:MULTISPECIES: hypothetical protein [unclassified Brucella]MRN44643.1 hypothetical protein [Brucella sp. 09RB8913]MRN58635.1 hypothetical protein [Brucella sp. 09RB8918]CAB4327305.1 hypothetical protein BCH_02702 [Brucella sp. 191011898]
MTYKIQITAPVNRAATIASKVIATTDYREFFGFRNRRNELPLIQVPIGLPVYRMENFRTFTDQRDFIATQGKPSHYFSAGQESEEVQQAQHQLLYRLALKGKTDSIVPVSDVLAVEGQRQPLLITADGVVVNGNRRLAALRELYGQGSKFSHFSHIDVLVLPADATGEEIVDIEANLQAVPETKLDYDWIGEAQLISRLVNMGRTPKEVGDQLRRKEKDIKYAIQTLAEADLYLKEAPGAEGNYSEIREDAEQLFGDLPKLLEGKSEQMKEASRVIAWTLYQNKGRLDGRLYDYNAAIGGLADVVLDRVADELGIATESVGDDSADSADDDFAIDIGEEAQVTSFAGVLDALKSTDNDAAVEALIEAAQAEIQISRGQLSGKAALKSVQQAHAKLASVDISKAEKSTLPKISKQLDAIKSLIDRLERNIAKQKS